MFSAQLVILLSPISGSGICHIHNGLQNLQLPRNQLPWYFAMFITVLLQPRAPSGPRSGNNLPEQRSAIKGNRPEVSMFHLPTRRLSELTPSVIPMNVR